jgi:formate hydrogenlyase transcriptional activator
MVDENIFFRQATLKLFSSLEIESALQRLLQYMQEYLPADGVVLGLYDPETNTSKLLAGIYPENMKQPPSTILFPSHLWDYFKEMWKESPGVHIVNDVSEDDPEIKKIISQVWPEVHSRIELDLEVENRRLGVFVVFASGKQRFNENHAKLIELLHDPCISAISNVLKHQEIQRLTDLLQDDNNYLNQRLLEITGNTIIGADFGLANVMEMVRKVAPMNSPVLLLGETGAGKEVIANAIHNASKRKGCPLIKVNCGAIPESLIDSELFGHEKGAFTGAVSTKRGLFERAHTGTIFLDEIGELPLAAQVRLLRVLQEKQIERVGGTKSVTVDVRVISATHRNLEFMVKKEKFREDLWFRLNVFPIIIPPLRQRPEDIPALINYFIERKAIELKINKPIKLSQQQMEQFRNYDWPGNVRELENTIERALITGTVQGVSVTGSPKSQPKTAMAAQQVEIEKKTFDQATKDYIEIVLKETNGRVEGDGNAAQWLDLHPSTLRAKMKKLGVSFGRSNKF